VQALNEEADCGKWHFKEAKGRSWHLMGSREWNLYWIAEGREGKVAGWHKSTREASSCGQPQELLCSSQQDMHGSSNQ